MNKYILLVFITFTCLKGYCQNTIPVSLKHLYFGDGVIFTAQYKLPIILQEGSRAFTPSLEEIKKAEMLLLSNSNDVNYKDLSGRYTPSKLKKTLEHFNRQYVGYQNSTSDRIILIHLLNFKNKGQARNNFDDWTNTYIIGFGDFYERNILTLMVNLTKKEVSYF
ncbi:MAG: hypothetical protein EOO47_28535 [Flavobacterium sp.]|nr:MAG: hypothetical protein EOO47_28535 [Flavobacterium sp.]